MSLINFRIYRLTCQLMIGMYFCGWDDEFWHGSQYQHSDNNHLGFENFLTGFVNLNTIIKGANEKFVMDNWTKYTYKNVACDTL